MMNHNNHLEELDTEVKTVSEKDQWLDKSKRAYLLATGGLFSALAACSDNGPQTNDDNSSETPTDFVAIGEDDTVDGQVCPMCENMPPPGNMPPVGGAPGTGSPGAGTPPGSVTPPGTGAPGNGTPPGTGSPGTGVGTPPDTGTPPVGDTPPATDTPVSAIKTFASLGPGLASIVASDMMGGLTQTLSDGTGIQVWGLTSTNNAGFNGDTNRIAPGPVIEAVEGEQMTIVFRSMHPHTIHLHGLDVDQANDGVPSTSGYVAGMMSPIFRRPPGENLGPIFEYRFVAPHAGTYMYHCHVDTVLHMEMGMVGTVIVRPADGSNNTLWTGGPVFDKEYLWHLHTFDSSWHNGLMTTGANTLRYQPDYFLINGRDGADILADSASAIEGTAGQTIALRLSNPGYQPALVTLGGIPFEVVASDGRPLRTPFNSLFTELMITPGERFDIIFTMPDVGVTEATVDYFNIQGSQILGTATSTITTI